ncbi:vWA domain-containing protein [Thermosynechococcus sp. FA-CM-4201]
MTADKAYSYAMTRLQMHNPFFGTLALFAQAYFTDSVPIAATNGKSLYLNPEVFVSLPRKQQDAVIIHEVLHMALLHAVRRGTRDQTLWNIAADIVVNGMIRNQEHLELLPGSLIDPDLERFDVEEVYACLQKRGKTKKRGKAKSSNGSQRIKNDLPAEQRDLLEEGLPDAKPVNGGEGDGNGHEHSGVLDQEWLHEIEAFWRQALQQAICIAELSKQRGTLPAGIERYCRDLRRGQVDWRTQLWRYLVHTPTDFQGFDRRFVYHNLYIETLIGESVLVYVAVDTSGSVSDDLIAQFLGEVTGILAAYPHIKVELYYADADIYGPYELDTASQIPKPQGGGGTDFCPFFTKVAERWDGMTDGVCVYLTDGYGNFPEEPPPLPVLWVVCPGGLDTADFPWGEVIRLI